jgi:hypothetical protein
LPQDAFSHFLGYTEDTVRQWFKFSTPEMKDFFYEKAFSCSFTRPDGRPVDFFVAGMTKVWPIDDDHVHCHGIYNNMVYFTEI